MSTKDIADLFGVSIDTVRSWRCASSRPRPRLDGNTPADLLVFARKNPRYLYRYLAAFAPDSALEDVFRSPVSPPNPWGPVLEHQSQG